MNGYESEQGRIVSPGKFEGEQEYLPEFWELALEGWGEDLGDGVVRVRVSEEQRKTWPELKGKWWVVMMETEQGWVIELTPKKGEKDEGGPRAMGSDSQCSGVMVGGAGEEGSEGD